MHYDVTKYRPFHAFLFYLFKIREIKISGYFFVWKIDNNMGHRWLVSDSCYQFVKYFFLNNYNITYIIFNENIATSIEQTAVPHNNIYLKKKELSRYLNFPNFKWVEKNTWNSS